MEDPSFWEQVGFVFLLAIPLAAGAAASYWVNRGHESLQKHAPTPRALTRLRTRPVTTPDGVERKLPTTAMNETDSEGRRDLRHR